MGEVGVGSVGELFDVAHLAVGGVGDYVGVGFIGGDAEESVVGEWFGGADAEPFVVGFSGVHGFVPRLFFGCALKGMIKFWF